MNWQDIKDVPKDGTLVTLGVEVDGGIVEEYSEMYWDPEGTNPPFQDVKGLWVHKSGAYKWSVANSDGAPTHFSSQSIEG